MKPIQPFLTFTFKLFVVFGVVIVVMTSSLKKSFVILCNLAHTGATFVIKSWFEMNDETSSWQSLSELSNVVVDVDSKDILDDQECDDVNIVQDFLYYKINRHW